MEKIIPCLLANKKDHDLPAEEFLFLVKNYSCPDNPILMAFSPAKARFEPFCFDESFIAATEQGRIFSPGGELKWRRIGSNYRVVYLGSQSLTEKFENLVNFSKELEPLKRGTSELILWGVRTDKKNEWIEQQIPQRFSYPISSDKYSRGRLAIEVENWHDFTGLPKFSRYQSLKEIP